MARSIAKYNYCSIGELWYRLFQENETAWRTRNWNGIRTDDEITAVMQEAFPDRSTMESVVKARERYRRGQLLYGRQTGRPHESYSYTVPTADEAGSEAFKGLVCRVTARGRVLTAGGPRTGPSPALVPPER